MNVWSRFLLRLVVLPLLVLGPALAGAAQALPEPRRSGFDFMGAATQAMQRDDTQNPGMLWVKDGEALWNRKAGQGDKACVTCHAAAQSSMRGVATRYPAINERTLRPVTLSQRINLCRQNYQQAQALALESQDLLSLDRKSVV